MREDIHPQTIYSVTNRKHDEPLRYSFGTGGVTIQNQMKTHDLIDITLQSCFIIIPPRLCASSAVLLIAKERKEMVSQSPVLGNQQSIHTIWW